MTQRVRCKHGFSDRYDCRVCVAIRAAFERAGRPNHSVCAICERVGHVSKFCPDTKVGRERLARGVA
jgi:hypothetical protein